MGIRELRAKYGRNLKGFVAVNAAIRAELPGGAELIDALQSLYFFLRLFPDDMHARRARADLQKVRERFAEEIARKYDLASAREDNEEET
jgi:hypothetical protein